MGYTKSLSQDWKATLRSLSLGQEVPSLPPTLRNLPNKSLERVQMQTRFQTMRQNQRQSLSWGQKVPSLFPTGTGLSLRGQAREGWVQTSRQSEYEERMTGTTTSSIQCCMR